MLLGVEAEAGGLHFVSVPVDEADGILDSAGAGCSEGAGGLLPLEKWEHPPGWTQQIRCRPVPPVETLYSPIAKKLPEEKRARPAMCRLGRRHSTKGRSAQ